MKHIATLGRLALLALPVAGLLAVAVPAGAEQQTAQPQAPQPQAPFAHASLWTGAALQGADLGAGDGMRAAIDPKTGELRQPSRAEVRALAAEESLRPARIFAASSVELADGTVMMALDEELMSYSVARLDAGRPSFTCVDGAVQADLQILSAPAAAGEEK